MSLNQSTIKPGNSYFTQEFLNLKKRTYVKVIDIYVLNFLIRKGLTPDYFIDFLFLENVECFQM